MININHVVITGRLTKDPEIRKTQSNLSVCSFTVAVNRRMKNEQGEYDADFINCVAWRQSADFLGQYGKKGDIVSVEGMIQTRNYEGKTGKVYITEIVADSVQLISKETKEEVKEIKTEPKWEYHQETLSGNGTDVTGHIEIKPEDLPFY